MSDCFPPPTLQFRAADDAIRVRVRDWRASRPAQPRELDYTARIRALVEEQASLHAAHLTGLSWPERYGGSGLGIAAEAVLAEELAASGTAELIGRLGLYMVGPTLMDFGTPEQCERFLPGMLDASELWCQGFSEPEAGSDLAAVRSTGRVDDDGVTLDGQKVWTSRAAVSRWCAALVRTQHGSTRHRGLSMVIVDMRAPGVSIRPLPQVLGEPHFNEVFFDGVRVPFENIIGEIDDGWRVAMGMLSYERGLFVLERQIRLHRRLAELTEELRRLDRGRDPEVCRRIGALRAQLELLRAQAYRTLAAQADGTLRAGATSVDKLLLSRAYQDLFGLATDLLGPGIAATDNGWTHDLLESRSVSIYGGTTEIQYTIVARQLLGIGGTR